MDMWNDVGKDTENAKSILELEIIIDYMRHEDGTS